MARFVPAFGISPGETVAIIGGGGKVPLIATLAREWAEAGGCPLITTTTKIFSFDAPSDYLMLDLKGSGVSAVRQAVRGHGRPGVVTLLGATDGREAVVGGIDPDLVREAAAELPADLTLVKADGSRGRSLKAHRDYEPVVPLHTSLVIAVAGVDAWGEALEEATVHRAELFAERWGYATGEPLDDGAFLRALGDPAGYRKRVPPGARYTVLLNKADDPARIDRASRLAETLSRGGIAALWGDVLTGRVESASEVRRG
jgi:probable selenium-dependent hydroxylase accessory protein YqeC